MVPFDGVNIGPSSLPSQESCAAFKQVGGSKLLLEHCSARLKFCTDSRILLLHLALVGRLPRRMQKHAALFAGSSRGSDGHALCT